MAEHEMTTTDSAARIQSLMDEAYSEWQKEENNGKGKWDVIGDMSEAHQIAVAFGNFNYQVENGGLAQWIYNGYFHDDSEKITGFLEAAAELDERCKTILDKIYQLDQCASVTECDRDGYYTDPDDEDGESQFIGDMVNSDAFDTWYYENCGKDDWWQTVCGIIDKATERDIAPVSQEEFDNAAATSVTTSRPLRVYIENAHHAEHGGFTLPLPTTSNELQSFLEKIEITDAESMKIWEVMSDIGDLGDVVTDAMSKSLSPDTINELNYLAVVLEEMTEAERETFNAVVEAGWHCGSLKDILNINENLDKFDLQPAFTAEEYGAHHINMARDEYAGVVEKLETSADATEQGFFTYFAEIESSVDLAAYGELQAENEGGVFTKQGYLTEGRNFEEIYRNPTDIPKDFCVYTEPEREPVISAVYTYAGANNERISETVNFPASEERIAELLQNASIDGKNEHVFFVETYTSSIDGLSDVLDDIHGGAHPNEINELAKNLTNLGEQGIRRFEHDLDYIGDIEQLIDLSMQSLQENATPVTDDKRIIEGYEVKQSIQLAGVEMIFAENNTAAQPYMVCDCTRNNPLAVEEYKNGIVDSDYLSAMREFIRRIDARLDSLDLDRVYRGTPLTDYALTSANCTPGGMDSSLEGKIVVVKAESLAPEYRSQSHQLMLATGGFGCEPNARGQAVFCTELYSGEKARWNRSDILGVASPDAVPDWAQEKLAAIQSKPQEKESVLAKLREAAAKPEQPHKPKSQDKSGPEL